MAKPKEESVYVGPKGPCTDCKSTTPPFFPARKHSPTGKARMIQLCEKCKPTFK